MSIELPAATDVAAKLAALGEPTRIRIVDVLRQGASDVTSLATRLGLEIVNVSHHLGVMRAAGLVSHRKDGRHVIYTLHPDVCTVAVDGTVFDFGWCRISVPVS